MNNLRYYVEPRLVYKIVDRATGIQIATSPLESDAETLCTVLNEAAPTWSDRSHYEKSFDKPAPMNFHPIENSSDTAQIIVPILVDWYEPASVLDLGCNVGWWLYWFGMHGVKDVLGIDGENMKENNCLLPPEFMVHDLTQPILIHPAKKGLKLMPRYFSLCLCLEVAEHLEEQYADTLVQTCINHSDRVIWSAATPGQGGYNHVNEQPHQYWIDKFATHGYTATYLGDKLPPVPHEYYRTNMFEFKKCR